jgi:hypothetical protein
MQCQWLLGFTRILENKFPTKIHVRRQKNLHLEDNWTQPFEGNEENIALSLANMGKVKPFE